MALAAAELGQLRVSCGDIWPFQTTGFGGVGVNVQSWVSVLATREWTGTRLTAGLLTTRCCREETPQLTACVHRAHSLSLSLSPCLRATLCTSYAQGTRRTLSVVLFRFWFCDCRRSPMPNLALFVRNPSYSSSLLLLSSLLSSLLFSLCLTVFCDFSRVLRDGLLSYAGCLLMRG